MLHLSNKGSKKSYAAKAACLSAGLVAVFASSSVFADQTPTQTVTRIFCAYKNGSTSDGLRLERVDIVSYRIWDGDKQVKPSDLNCTDEHNERVTLASDSRGPIRFMIAAGLMIAGHIILYPYPLRR